ncbi:unnamed protein product [Caenorhabditis auriculariae]|uniref:Protein BCCIP homolog n=1 Tax=Caenorhabditis auriculariae TaxID=2777116 RepID=A0A8S1HR38_9PELO|nr:unnamed protein product [Caenorhabditis auriculariae]
MGKVLKKKAGSAKRTAVQAATEPAKKRTKKEEDEKQEEVEELDDVEDEDEDEEELSDEDDQDAPSDGDDNELDFNFEAFPMEEGDREGLFNILTQIFLRAEVDTKVLADALIAQSPFGSVVGPADDESDDDDPNAVYALFSVLPLTYHGVTEEYAKEVTNYILSRAKKYANKEFLRRLEEILGESTALFINERFLNFSQEIIPPAFRSLREDVAGSKKPVENFIYIQKIRIAEKGAEDESGPSKSKRKMGKAEKKRLAAASLSMAPTIFDNAEDEFLTKITEGSEIHFDFPVHMDVEPGSKFHSIEKNGQKYMPFRRVTILDGKRLDAFLKREGALS